MWVPVSEYRPDSAAVVYRIDPDTYRVHEAFRVADHIGGVATDPRSGKVHGITWGSLAFYTWDRHGKQLIHRMWAAPDDGEASGSTELLLYTARVA